MWPRGEATAVIVAEDEAVIRMDLVEMQKELGYDVVAEAFNGERAVELVRQHRPDLAFLDIAMPVRDGLSAAEEISRLVRRRYGDGLQSARRGDEGCRSRGGRICGETLHHGRPRAEHCVGPARWRQIQICRGR